MSEVVAILAFVLAVGVVALGLIHLIDFIAHPGGPPDA